MHTALQGLRQVADKYNSVLIGETWTKDIKELNEYYGPTLNELQLPMNFMFTSVNKVSAPDFRKQIAWADSVGWVASMGVEQSRYSPRLRPLRQRQE